MAEGLMDSLTTQKDNMVSGSPDIEAALKAAEGEVTDAKPVGRLAELIQNDWQAARDSRAKTVDQLMLQNLRQVKGKYDPDHLAAIKASAGGSEVFMMITHNIAKTAEARLHAIQTQSDPAWTLEPTPLPDLPEDVEAEISQRVATETMRDVAEKFALAGQPFDPILAGQELGSRMVEMRRHAKSLIEDEAKARAEGMFNKMQDQCKEGGLDDALAECRVDLFRNLAVFLKGPIVRNEKTLKWVKSKSGKYTMKTGINRKIVFERVAPENIYPLIGTTNIRHGGLIEFHRLSRADLNNLIGLPGYNDKEIRAALEEYGVGGLTDWTIQTITSSVADIMDEATPLTAPTDPLIDALQYWNSVKGSVLREYGLSDSRIPDPDIDYEVEAWLVGTHVIRCVLNPDPLGEHPYSSTGFHKEPGCFWHTSLPEVVRGPQMQCNASGGRALANNVAIASGPLTELDVDRVSKDTVIKPWAKIWSTNDQMMKGPAVKFNDIPLKAGVLLDVYNAFEAKAYIYAGIPNPNAEISPTLGGTSIDQTDKNKGIKLINDTWRRDIVATSMRRLYRFNMLFDDDESIKGDVDVVIKDNDSMVAQELKLKRDIEFLGLTNNPTDFALMGAEGRQEALKQVVKENGNDPSRMVTGDTSQIQGNPGQAAPVAKPSEMDAAGNAVAGRDFSVTNN